MKILRYSRYFRLRSIFLKNSKHITNVYVINQRIAGSCAGRGSGWKTAKGAFLGAAYSLKELLCVVKNIRSGNLDIQSAQRL